jgi:hypothetical protein
MLKAITNTIIAITIIVFVIIVASIILTERVNEMAHMKPRQYFPLGKAYGDAFCNRTQETKALTGNVENGKHTFLAAPRRYGKSSLCENAINRTGLPNAKVDLHVTTSEKGIERHILKGVLEKSVQSMKYAFKNLKPKLSLTAIAFQLELDIVEGASAAEPLGKCYCS